MTVVFQSIAYGGHKIWCWMKSKNKLLPLQNLTQNLKEAQDKHIKTIPKYSQVLDSTGEPYVLPIFNTPRFNHDILNPSITKISLTFGVICIIPLTFYFVTRSSSFPKKFLSFIIEIFICLFHPLQFFIQSKKLRSYLLSHFK